MNRLLSLFLFLSAPMLGFAQSYEKNGLPCIAELCVGDGLEELSRIKWDRAKSALSLMGKPDYVGSRPRKRRLSCSSHTPKSACIPGPSL
jgi:hypothetical protein